MIITEPWEASEDPVRTVEVIGTQIGAPRHLVLLLERPIGWGDHPPTSIVAVRNRYSNIPWVDEITDVTVNGVLWPPIGSDSVYAGFLGQLELDGLVELRP